MDREMRKIARACFIGGVLFCIAALLVSPRYWWLGMAAGFAGGYLSYEFRSVLAAIPTAWKAAKRTGAGATSTMFMSWRNWWARPHPFLFAAVPIVLVLQAAWFYNTPYEQTWGRRPTSMTYIMLPILYTELYVIGVGVLTMILSGVASIGAFRDNAFWKGVHDTPRYVEEVRAQGYREVTLTYQNAYPWVLMGAWMIGKFFCWTIWKFAALALWFGVLFIGRFCWYLFRLIHSDRRLLCAVDGTLGGVTSYFMLGTSVMTLPEMFMLIGFGGILGAAFGVVNWELVSKRILRLAPARVG